MRLMRFLQEEFGKDLKKVRIAREKSLRKVEEETGVSSSTVWDTEERQQTTAVIVLAKWAGLDLRDYVVCSTDVRAEDLPLFRYRGTRRSRKTHR